MGPIFPAPQAPSPAPVLDAEGEEMSPEDALVMAHLYECIKRNPDPEYVVECRWLISYIDCSMSGKEIEHLVKNGVLSTKDAFDWIGFRWEQGDAT